MPIIYRTLIEDDWDDWVAGNAHGFLADVEEAAAMNARARPLIDFDRGLGARDGDELVGRTQAISFSMSVPGGHLPTAGVTAVTVLPTHRRRGILTELMRRQLDDIHERGEPLAALWSSETLIYGRFGYGLTAQSDRASIDRRHTGFRAEVPEAPGEVRFVDSDAALERWPPLYERLRETRPGMMNRIPGHWSAFIIPPRREARGWLLQASVRRVQRRRWPRGLRHLRRQERLARGGSAGNRARPRVGREEPRR